jgi:hypothetical protein
MNFKKINSEDAYPTTDEIMNNDEMIKSEETGDIGGNPVVDAFRTIALFAKAQAEQGNTKILDWVKQGIDMLSGGTEQEKGIPEQPPAEGVASPPGGMMTNMPRGMRPEMGMTKKKPTVL